MSKIVLGMKSSTHESFDRPHVLESSSDRSFGLVFTAFFALLGVWPLVHKHPIRLWALGLSGVFLLLALAVPRVLHPLNLAWTVLGRVLSKITNPIITGLLFYLIFTPAALLFRLMGKDLLRLKFDRSASSYWIVRDPSGPAPESMSHQF
jgi:saxitoxin biosynthesis operon SxtJ-like protein